MAEEQPGKPEAEVTAEDQKDQASNSTVKDDGTVEVDVDKIENSNDKVETPTEDKTPDEPKYVTADELKKVQNAIAYQTRMVEKVLKKPQEATDTPAPSGREPNEIDQAANKDWQQGVRMLIQDEFKNMSEQQKKQAEQEIKKQNDLSVMNANQNYVLDQYPDLKDQYSETSKRYAEVCDELAGVDAGFYGNPYGPIAAMRKMEEKMRKEGVPLPGVKEQADEEISRRARVGAVAQTPAKPATSKGKYVLDADQRAFCDQNNIPYDQYALNASKLDRGASLEA